MQLYTSPQNNCIACSYRFAQADIHETDDPADSSFEQQDWSSSPLKNSYAETQYTRDSIQRSEDSWQEEDEPSQEKQLCEDYFQKGCCHLGNECQNSHQKGESKQSARKRAIHNQIMSNFPQLMVCSVFKRINSFLQ